MKPGKSDGVFYITNIVDKNDSSSSYYEPPKLTASEKNATTDCAANFDKSVAENMKEKNFQSWKYLILLSFCVLGCLLVLDMVRYIESSLLHDLGTLSLAVVYGANVLSLLVLPSAIIGRLGLKWTLVLSMVCFIPFFVAHMYPKYYTLIPGSIITGFGLGMVDTTANCVVTELALEYSSRNKVKAKKVLNNFFGVFVMIILMSRTLGNLLSAFLVNDPNQQKAKLNVSTCGFNYCNSLRSSAVTSNYSYSYNRTTENTTLDNEILPYTSENYVMFSLGIVVPIICAVSIAVWFKNIPCRKNSHCGTASKTSHITKTLKMLLKYKLVLLMVSSFAMGSMESFISGDFTRAFVTCSLGVNFVGKVLICYGVASAATASIAGLTANKVGRGTVVAISFALFVSLIFFMMFWTVDPGQKIIYYVIVGGWGVADAFWRTQLFSILGLVFSSNSEGAFANEEIFESLGLAIGYLVNPLLCMKTKLFLSLAFIVLGMIGYSVVEGTTWRERRLIRKNLSVVTLPAKLGDTNKSHLSIDTDLVSTNSRSTNLSSSQNSALDKC